MISHTQQFQPIAIGRQLLAACVQVMRNRWELRDLDATQMLDAGISPEALREATDLRFWRRVSIERARREPMPVVRHAADRHARREPAPVVRGPAPAREFAM